MTSDQEAIWYILNFFLTGYFEIKLDTI